MSDDLGREIEAAICDENSPRHLATLTVSGNVERVRSLIEQREAVLRVALEAERQATDELYGWVRELDCDPAPIEDYLSDAAAFRAARDEQRVGRGDKG